jgi:hypothetical protein
MKYKVFDLKTGKDITDQRKWVIYSDGRISYVENGLLFWYPENRVKIEINY